MAAYAAARAYAGDKYSTLVMRLAAMHLAHVFRDHPSPRNSPDVRTVLHDIRRTHGTLQARKAPPLLSHLQTAFARPPSKPVDLGNRALILPGFAGGFRRSEFVGLRVENLAREKAGIRGRLPRSKTDHDGAGRTVVVSVGGTALCPLLALQDWLTAAGIEVG